MLAGIKFGGWVLNGHCKILADFNLAVRYRIAIRWRVSKKFCWLQRQAAKLPNLIPHQIFWLYGSVQTYSVQTYRRVGLTKIQLHI